MPKRQVKIRLPSERDNKLLRIARSHVVVTYGDGKRRPTTYCYDGGELTPEAFSRLTRNGWLVPGGADALLIEAPQSYRVRKP